MAIRKVAVAIYLTSSSQNISWPDHSEANGKISSLLCTRIL